MVPAPSRRTFYRLFERLAHGLFCAQLAVDGQPPGRPVGELPASAPGELMQIDPTPLDVLARLDGGVATRVDLTG